MLCRPAENCFARGLAALREGRIVEALAMFESAITVERQHGWSPPQPRYLSYYGVCIAEQTGRFHEGIRVCREALDREFYNPDLYWNLGRLLLRGGRRREAWAVLQRGRRIHPSHPGIRAELTRMGARRRPVIPFLDRANLINVTLGRLSCSLREVRRSRH